ncbi:hypothetical protein MMC13_005538 [Lambiella insularis]|nr:hypothetical protein [Lambiella insularis]
MEHSLDTGKSIVEPNPDPVYVSETFGTDAEPDDIRLNQVAPPYPPHLRFYDALNMNNLLSGGCERVPLALAVMMSEKETKSL